MNNPVSSPVMKRNPRPRKYASDADRQAAYRSRNAIVEFRAEPQTAEKLNQIAETIDVSRSDLVLSMVKFALTNHDWARFGLTHKTIPLYKGNPMKKDLPFKPTNANLENEAKFLENYAKDSLNTWIILGQTEKYSEIMDDVNRLRHTKKIKGLNNRTEYLEKYFEKVKKGDFYKGNPMTKKTFLMTEKSGNRIETPYDFIFTHYIPMNSYGGSKVAFRFVGQNVFGDVIVSEYESGKKVGQITNYEMIKNHITSDRTAAKKLIENLLMKYGADKVYSVLTKA